MQFREHRGFSANIDCTFDNTIFAVPRTGTVGAGNVGLCWYFIVFPASMLNGNRLNITTSSSGVDNGFLRLFDGDYDRALASDWPQAPPNQLTPLLKGNGILEVIQAGIWGKTVDSFIVDEVSLTGFITLALNAQDAGIQSANVVFYQVSIQNAVTGAIIWEQDWDVSGETFVYEQTGTQQDYGYVELDDDLPCIGIDFEILNPSAKAEDGTPWVFTETKFYFFNATYANFELTSDTASIRFSPDGTTNVIVNYDFLNDINGLLSVVDPADFVTVPSVARNFTGALYNSTSRNLWVSFPIWFTDNSPDAQNVDVFYQCSPAVGFIDTGEDFHIYNQGGLVEKSTPPQNASWTVGGDWYEGCVAYSSVIAVNQTWRKPQHFQTEYALRFYTNDSGVWVPEDQWMQSNQNRVGGEIRNGFPGQWSLAWLIWAWDNSSQLWVRQSQMTMSMIDGDEGANDEWIAINSTVFTRDPVLGSQKHYSQVWNAFIEEEPAARYRTWLDVWINKINASSVIGWRSNAYYFGMESTAWLLWGTWNPMIYNSTEAIAFDELSHNDTSIAFAREFDLFKIGMVLSFSLDYTLSNPPNEVYRVCIEDVNINEVLLASHGEMLSGVNTPIFNAPKVPELAIQGILAPLYAAIQRLGETLWSALSGLTGIIWSAIDARFPWFTAFWAGLLVGISDLATIFVRIFGWLSQLFAWGVNFIGLIATPITIIEQSWISIVNATSVWAGVAPNDVAIIFIIMFGILFPLEALGRGDASVMLKVLELTWAVARTFIFLMMRIGTFLVNALLELVPF